MEKIYYTEKGWVCQRYPYDLPVTDESRFIEVEEKLYNETLSSPEFFAWRVVNGELVNEHYEDLTAEEQEEEKQSNEIALNSAYIPSVEKSVSFFAKAYLKTNPPQDTEEKLMLSGLYDTFDKNNPKKREVGDLVNALGQTYECIQAHDEAVYPDINPNNPQTWHTFYKPLHGKSKETAHPFVQPKFGTTDMYIVGEYMVYTDGKYYKCLRNTVYSPEEYAADWEILN